MENAKNCSNAVVKENELQWTTKTSNTQSLKSYQILTTLITCDVTNTWIITVYYADVVWTEKCFVLRKKSVDFYGTEGECENLQDAVNRILTKYESHRPKKVLAMINPISGMRSSLKNYNSIVQPLFDLCHVESDVIETVPGDHPTEVLASRDLSNIDVIISMGGDGTNSRVVCGLLRRTMTDSGVNIEDPECQMIPAKIPVAIVPSGSGNGTSVMVNHTYTDVEMSALNIILGYKTKSDATILRTMDGKFLRFTFVTVAFGFYGALWDIYEKLRFLRHHRYLIYPLVAWKTWRSIPMKLEYKTISDDETGKMSDTSTKNAKGDVKEHQQVIENSDVWKTFNGKIPMLDVTHYAYCYNLIEHVFQKTERPYERPNVNHGIYEIFIDKSESFFKSFGVLWNRLRGKPLGDRVERHKATECRVYLEKEQKREIQRFISYDGEPLPIESETAFHVKMFPNAIELICTNDNLSNLSEVKDDA